MRKRYLICSIIALLTASIILTCSASPTIQRATIAQSNSEKTFIIAMGEGAQSANPFVGIYDSDYMLYSCIYDCLMYPNEDGAPTPNLARSWWFMDGAVAFSTGSDAADLLNRDPSYWPLGSIWEYNLTEGVTWNDGEIFDADDVKYTIDLQTGKNYASFWSNQPYMKWIDHCQKVNEYKIRIFFTDRTTNGNPSIPVSWGASLLFPIMPKHALQSKTTTDIAQNWTGVPLIGTGPFMVDESLIDDYLIGKERIVLIKNPEWEKGLGKIWDRTCEIDKLILRFYSEEQTLILDLKTNKIDVAEITPINYLSLEVGMDKPAGLHLVSTFSLTVNTKVSHFIFEKEKAAGELNPARSDPAVHRATALATDRDYIVDDIFRGMGEKGVGLLTPAVPKWYYDAYEDDNNRSWFNVTDSVGNITYSYNDTISHIMDYNEDRANEILNASGYNWTTYPDGYRIIGTEAAKRLVAMGMATTVDSAMKDKNGNQRHLSFQDIYEQEVFEDQDISKYLQAAWKEIGVEMVPTAVNTQTFNKLLYYYQTTFGETSQRGNPDPNFLLYIPSNYSRDGWNEFGQPDPYYDYCYMKQSAEMDESERVHWVHECEKYLFLSGTASMTTCDPMTCYAFVEDEWTNWGNWTEHPGLAIDHYWGETPILLNIEWAIEPPPNYNGIIAALTAAVILIGVAATAVIIRRRRIREVRRLQDEEDDTTGEN